MFGSSTNELIDDLWENGYFTTVSSILRWLSCNAWKQVHPNHGINGWNSNHFKLKQSKKENAQPRSQSFSAGDGAGAWTGHWKNRTQVTMVKPRAIKTAPPVLVTYNPRTCVTSSSIPQLWKNGTRARNSTLKWLVAYSLVVWKKKKKKRSVEVHG